MTTQTTNYSFTKDDINEPYDVLRVNANLDAIDTEIKKKETQIGDKANLVTVTKTNLVAAINEVKEQTNSIVANKADLVNGKVPSIQLPNIEVPVQSVNSKTGAVVLTKLDIGLGNVDNTADSAKAVLSAIKLATPRAINGVNFDGTANITVADGTKAPTSHASTGTGYGIGTTANYGHVKTINDLNQASHVDGMALSAYQGKLLKELASSKSSGYTLKRTITINSSNVNTDIPIPSSDFINSNRVLIILRGTFSLTTTTTGVSSFVTVGVGKYKILPYMYYGSLKPISGLNLYSAYELIFINELYSESANAKKSVMWVLSESFDGSHTFFDASNNILFRFTATGAGIIFTGTVYADIYTRRMED